MSIDDLLDLLEQLRAAGIDLFQEGDTLRYRAPAQALTQDLRERIAAQKPEIIEHLRTVAHRREENAPIHESTRERPIPLSWNQQRLWVLEQLAPGTATYNLPLVLRLSGPVDFEALESAVNAVVNRHEALRTTVGMYEGLPVQNIAAPTKISLPVHVLGSAPDVQDWKALAQAEVRRAFDLVHGPLYRCVLYRIAPETHVLLLCFHHIVVDGWSLDILTRDIVDAYAGKTLPQGALQFADIVAWQRDTLEGSAAFARQLTHWRERLQGAPEMSSFPTDRPRSPLPTFVGETHRTQWSAELSAAVRKLSQSEGATVFMTVLAAFQILLARYSGQMDVCVGTAIANRSRPEYEAVVGFFANTLAMRADLSDNPTFREFLARVRATALDAFANQDVPFERLVEIIQPRRELSHQPLFQVMFALQSPRHDDPTALGVVFHREELENDVSPFDLTLSIVDEGGAIRAGWNYNRDLYGVETIRRIANHLEVLLDAAVSRRDCRLADLPWMSPIEYVDRLRMACGEDLEYPRDLVVSEIFEARAAAFPDRIAVIGDGEQLTYLELNQRANRFARHLQALGVTMGSLVSIALERSVEFVIAILGVLKAGGAYVPVDSNSPEERIRFLLRDANVALLVTQRHTAARWNLRETKILQWDDYLSTAPNYSGDNQSPRALPESLAYVIYTSGSTGRPKGVMVNQRQLIHLTVALQRYHRGQTKHFLLISSLAFDTSVEVVHSALLSGGTLNLPPTSIENSVPDLAEWIAKHSVSTLVTLPSFYSLLLDQPKIQLESLKHVVVAAEPCTGELVLKHRERLPRAALHNEYGPTETTVACTVYDTKNWRHDSPVPIGHPHANMQVYVLDAHLSLMPVGVAGEIYIGGPGVANGYIHRPDLTAERFIPDPFAKEPGGRLFRTGDLARVGADLSIVFLGRNDGQVKVRGYRIEFGEVEAAIKTHPLVQAVAVLARSEPHGGKVLIAFVVVKAGQTATRADLTHHLESVLPSYMVPGAWVFLHALPQLANGKVDRNALAHMAQEHQTESPVFYAPSTAAEIALAEIWSQVLRRPQIGLHDNFFNLGGDSIVAMQVVARARDAGWRLLPRQLFQHQTLQELAAVAEPLRALVPASAEPMSSSVPLTPIQRWFFEQSLPNPDHWNQALLLIPTELLDMAILERAFQVVFEYHEALRFRYVQTPHGWEQYREQEIPHLRIEHIRLSDDDLSSLDDHCTKLHANLDLARGRLVNVAYFDLGAGQTGRLLIVVHHLVIDGVSWRIFIEDLETAYRQLLAGQTVRLPPKSATFQTWAEGLQHVDLHDEVAYWQSYAWESARALPRDNPHGNNRVERARTVRQFLDEANSHALLTEVPRAYLTQINDVLLTALAMALKEWLGDVSVAIDLEGHGREPFFDDIDLSRTIGWFTSVFPVLLDLGSIHDPGAALENTKEHLRRIPHRGIGYGVLRHLQRASLGHIAFPEIAFNYLGQFDQVLSDKSLFRMAPESTGRAFDPTGDRSHVIQIDAWISDGRLQIEWTHSEDIHHQQTILRVAEAFLAALRMLIVHCQSSKTGGYLPADFPLAKLSKESLNRIVGGRRDVEDIYPLTPSQQGLLFQSLYEHTGAGVYFQQLVWTFDANFQPAVWRRAWESLISRHPSLRTAFVWDGLDEPLQIVASHVVLPREELDWRGTTWNDATAKLTEWLHLDRQRPFLLSSAPLLRLALMHAPEGRVIAVWSFHHLLQDGWSLPLVLAHLETLYRGYVTNDIPRLPQCRPYKDYVAWFTRQDKAATDAFWRQKLRGFGATTPFVVDRPALPGRWNAPSSYGEERVIVSPRQTQKLEAFVRDARLTMSTLVQCAWALLLARYAGEDEVLFGTTVAGRSPNLPGIENMMGLFINTIPVRIAIPRHGSTRDWLRAVQADLVELQQYEHASLAELQTFSGVPGLQPLFESLVVFENYPFAPPVGGNHLPLWEFQAYERTHYPMTVFAEPGSSLRIRLSYQSARFDAASVRRMAGHLHTLLEAMATSAHESPRDLPLLVPAEYEQIVRGFNQTKREYPVHTTLPARIAMQAAKTPQAIAVEYEDARMTYAELNARYNQLARYLREQRVGPEVIVGVFLERSLDMLIALLGVLAAGGTYLPLDPIFPAERIRLICADAKPAIILTRRELSEFLPAPEARVVCLDRDGAEIARQSSQNLAPGVSPTNSAYVIYTSGSTGKPKGVLVSHGALMNFLHAMQDLLELASTDALLAVTTISFDIAGLELYLPLIAGARIVIANRDTTLDGLALADTIERRNITVMQATPTTWHLLLAAKWRGSPALRILCGGEALPAELAEQLRPRCAELWNMYGPTETTIWSTAARITSECPEITIGRPIANTQAYVLDDALRPLPIGVPGELYLGGDGLAEGYFRRPDLTAERFFPDPFCSTPDARLYRTGDRARLLPDGRIEHMGRRDNQVKIRGYRIELGEIETVLGRHAAVGRAVVAVKEIPTLGSTLVAYVVPAGPAPTIGELRAHVQETLPHYMVPPVYVFLDNLPQTPNGKIDRQALPLPGEHRIDAPKSASVPTPPEQMLAHFWAEILGISRVNVDDHFFELGGHSLLVTRLFARIRGTLRLDVPFRTIFEHPTLREFVNALLQYEKTPGQLQALAQAWQKLQRLSPAERKALLEKRKTS